MTYDEDDDLFQPTTFKGKLKEKLSNISYDGWMSELCNLQNNFEK